MIEAYNCGMGRKYTPTEYSKQTIGTFKEKLSNPLFTSRIDAIYDAMVTAEKRKNMIIDLMLEFNLRGNSFKFVEHYIFTKEIDASKITGGIGWLNQETKELFWDNFDEVRFAKADYQDFVTIWEMPVIAILILPGVKKSGILEYIQNNRLTIIRMLKIFDKGGIKGVRETKTKDRNREIDRLSSQEGLQPKQIMEELNLKDEMILADVNHRISKHRKSLK